MAWKSDFHDVSHHICSMYTCLLLYSWSCLGWAFWFPLMWFRPELSFLLLCVWSSSTPSIMWRKWFFCRDHRFLKTFHIVHSGLKWEISAVNNVCTSGCTTSNSVRADTVSASAGYIGYADMKISYWYRYRPIQNPISVTLPIYAKLSTEQSEGQKIKKKSNKEFRENNFLKMKLTFLK